MNSRTDRRTLLKTLGMVGLGGVLPCLRPTQAFAAEAPKRLIFVRGSHGVAQEYWRPRGPNGGQATENNWELAPDYRALQPFKNKLTMVSGVYSGGAHLQKGNTDNVIGSGHARGQLYSWTNHLMDGMTKDTVTPLGPSIDQTIAEYINTPQPVTLRRSVLLGRQGWGRSWIARGQPAPHLEKLDQAYTSIFRDFTPEQSQGPNNAQADMLDFLTNEYGLAARSLDTRRKEKLDQHTTLLSELRQLKGSTLGGGASCTETPRGSEFAPSNVPAVEQERWFKLATAVLACDISRVVSVPMYEPWEETGYKDGQYNTPDWHQLAHKVGLSGKQEILAQPNGAQTLGLVAELEVWRKRHEIQAQHFAEFLGMLDAIKESDGKSLLDHSCVVWIHENATPVHNHGNFKIMLAGNFGGAFQSNRYLTYHDDYSKGYYHTPGTGGSESIGNLWVSMANGMGMQIDRFGAPGASTGPLTGL